MPDPYQHQIVEIRERLQRIVRDLPQEALPYALKVLAEIERGYDKSVPPDPPPGRPIQ